MFSTRPKVAVFIHGCHLQADLDGQTWAQIVLDPQPGTTVSVSRAGRLVEGLYLAWQKKASMVVFSTGASQIDGVLEGQWTLRTAILHAAAIAPLLGTSAKSLRKWLNEVAVVDSDSQNTTEEVARNLERARQRGIDEVYLVSSPWHIQRCLTEALKFLDANQNILGFPLVHAHASLGSPRDIVILEPPHRGDRPKTQWHTLARRLFKISESDRFAAETALNALLTQFNA